jgi:hypothetical protein
LSGRFDEAPLGRFGKKSQAYVEVYLDFFLAFFFLAMIVILGV